MDRLIAAAVATREDINRLDKKNDIVFEELMRRKKLGLDVSDLYGKCDENGNIIIPYLEKMKKNEHYEKDYDYDDAD
ncbi:MAG: hypothetical protein LBS43_06325 [Prevotellaceae bacterium]|nr:hypothetical protein [Prevotellaceae bacterium]